MKLELIEINADSSPRDKICLEEIDLQKLINALLKTGNDTIILKGELLDDFDDGIFLFSDSDIKSLIIAYLEIEKEVSSTNVYEHGEFLNDGLLNFTAECDGEKVNLEFRYCPELNVKNLVVKNVTLTPDEYLWWWRSIANSIYNIAKSIEYQV
jgi:hypothetical protein